MRRKQRLVVTETQVERDGSLAVALVAAVMPLVYWPVARDPNLAKPVLLALVLAIALAIVAVRVYRGESLRFRPNALDVFVVAYSLLIFASWTYSSYKDTTVATMRPAFLYLLFYLLARTGAVGERGRRRVIGGLLAGCTVVSVLGIAQQYGQLGWGSAWWVGSTWFNRTFLAAYLLLILPVAIWGIGCGRGWLRLAGVTAMAAGLPATVFTGARIVWAGVIPMACVAALIAWPIVSARRRRAIIVAVAVAISAGTVSQAVLSRVRPSRAPFEIARRAFDSEDSGNEVRLALMMAAVRVGLDRPILGGGAGTFPVYGPERISRVFYKNALHSQSISSNVVVRDAHNEFAQVFASLGAVGLILFLAIPVSAALNVRWTIRRKDAPLADKWLGVASLAGVVGFLAANMVGISARVPGEAALYYLLAALIGSVMRADPPSDTAEGDGLRRWLVPAFAVTICILLAIAWAGVCSLRASVHVIIGETLMTSAADIAGANAALAEFRIAARLTPKSPMAQYDLANALAVTGRHREALRVYKLVEGLSPDYGRVHFNQGTSLYNLRRYSDAEREMARAYRLDGLPDSRMRLDYLRDLLRAQGTFSRATRSELRR